MTSEPQSPIIWLDGHHHLYLKNRWKTWYLAGVSGFAIDETEQEVTVYFFQEEGLRLGKFLNGQLDLDLCLTGHTTSDPATYQEQYEIVQVVNPVMRYSDISEFTRPQDDGIEFKIVAGYDRLDWKKETSYGQQ